MIVVEISDRQISIKGHAYYAEKGKDIICASVSMLAQALIISLEELTDDDVEYKITDGHIDIKHKDLSRSGELLKRSFFIAVKKLEEDYGDSYVKVNGADGR